MALKNYDFDYPFEEVKITSHDIRWKLEYRRDKSGLRLLSVCVEGQIVGKWSTDLKDWLETLSPEALKELDDLARVEIKARYE